MFTGNIARLEASLSEAESSLAAKDNATSNAKDKRDHSTNGEVDSPSTSPTPETNRTAAETEEEARAEAEENRRSLIDMQQQLKASQERERISSSRVALLEQEAVHAVNQRTQAELDNENQAAKIKLNNKNAQVIL